MKGKKIAAVLSLLISLSMSYAVQPANADDLTRILNGILGRGSVGFDANEQATLNSLITTQSNLEGMISTGLANGSISPAQAANFRMRLGTIANLQSNFMADGDLTWPEVQSLVSQYSTLTSEVNTHIAAGVGAGVNIGGGFGGGWGSGVYGQGAVRIDRMQARLAAMIDRGVANGSLNMREAARLRSQLAVISQQEASFRLGGLNRWEIATLTNRLDNLRTRIDAQISDRQFAGRRDFWY
jgi:hypothetical protein